MTGTTIQASASSASTGASSQIALRTRRSRRMTATAPASSPPPTPAAAAKVPSSPASPTNAQHGMSSRVPLARVKVPQPTSDGIDPRSPGSSAQTHSTSDIATISKATVATSPTQLMPSTSPGPRSPPTNPSVTSAAPSAASNTDVTLAQEDPFARAQAMGLRLTREEYEQTRAGVTAFLREDREHASDRPGPRRSSPFQQHARASGEVTQPPMTLSAPQSVKDGVVSEPAESVSRYDDQVLDTSSVNQPTSASWRPHLPFFTAGVPLRAKTLVSRPKLDDIGNAEEKRKRKERRRRQQQRNLASGSMSEPDTSRTPRMSGGSQAPSSTFGESPVSGGGSSASLIGLGLGSSGSRHSIGIDASTPETSPLAGSCFHRARTLSATTLPSSSNLQAAVSESATSTSSPGLRLLSSRSRTSSNGRLRLAAGGSTPEQSERSRAAGFITLVESDDDRETEVKQPLDTTGRLGAAHDGWGVSSSSCRNGRALQKLGLLDRVMRDKGSPTRSRSNRRSSTQRASEGRRLSDAHSLPMETIAFAMPLVKSAPSHDGNAPSALVPTSQLGPPFPVNTHPGSNIAYVGKDSLRRRSHSRQMSQAGKTVRWAPTVGPAGPSTFTPGHQRMTTRDHYEFFVHGISPDTSVDLSELVVDQPQFIVVDSAQNSMPWLYGPHTFVDDGEVSSSTFRIDGSPMGRSPSRMSVTVDDFHQLGSSIDFDYEHGHQDRRQSVTARRGLLFGPSAGSPTHSTVNRFNPGFSDPALSQSPQRSSILSGRHTRGKSSLGSIRDLFTNGQLAVTRTSEVGGQAASASPVQQSTRTSVIQHPNHPTVSPAAIFGGALAPAQAQGIHNGGTEPSRVLPRASPSDVLPEPTKPWPRNVEPGTAKELSESLQPETIVPSEEIEMAGLARVRSGGIMDWGVTALQRLPDKPDETAPRVTPAAAKSAHRPTGSTSKGKAAASSATVPSAPFVTPAPRRTAPVNIGPLPLDPKISEFVRPDGSRVVKLVSEELQAALESGEFEEPPPRYYVLPVGAGATKAKPPHVSYAGLIGQAILTSSDQRLSLAEIYNWISTVHPFFERGDRGWQNSIRHNLSLNKSFIKVEREANIPGKGGWWAIKEGHEERFKEGLYSAGPGGAVEKSGSGGNSSSKKSKKKAYEGQEVVGTPAAAQLSSSETSGWARPEEQNPRKRQMSDGNAGGNDNSCPSSPSRQHSSKAAKKAKPTAAAAARLPLADVTNRQTTGPIVGPPRNVVHYGGFFAATPARQGNADQRYMASSGGMPALTDSASSPPASPAMFEAEVLMPPPPSTKRKAARRDSQQGRVAFFNGAGPQAQQEHPTGIFGVNSYQSSQSQQQQQQQQQQYTNLYFNGNGSNTGVFYPPQPSPLAGRWRNPSGGSTELSANVSPLRRSTTSPSKVVTHSPVSSLRGSASSALAGAMNVGGGGATARHRRTGSGLGGGLTANGQPFFVHHNPFQQGMTANRGSPSRRSSTRQDISASNAAAAASLQVALGQKSGAGPGQSLPVGGNGTASNVTSGGDRQSGDKGTPNTRGATGVLLGVSPSPTSRRYQASQNQLGWLENPYDYQDALQRELEGMSGVASNASAGHPTPPPHYGSSMSGGIATSGMPAAMDLMSSPNGSPTRLGTGWLSTATQQDNISAVRGSPDRRD